MTTDGTGDLLRAHCRPHPLPFRMLDMAECATFRDYISLNASFHFSPKQGIAADVAMSHAEFNWAFKHTMLQTVAVECFLFKSRDSLPLLSKA